MTPILLLVLYLLLYVAVGVLIIELILWILGMLVALPGRLRQILYAILAICVLIWLVTHLPHML